MSFCKITQIQAVFILLFFLGCSTQKDAMLNRWYHKLNTKYNGLFYAKEHLSDGIKKIKEAHKDNYDNILFINEYADLKAAKSAQSSLDQAIEKSTNAIKQHSMEIDGEEKNKLIPEAYMVIGKSKFYKREYVPAINTFNYIARKSSNTETQTEALLWVARCNQQLNNSQALKKTLSNIELDHYLNKKHEAVFFQIQAELAISKKEYTTAIQLLSKAISTTKNKTLNTRMYYMLGQLSLLEGNYANAFKHFEKVVKQNPKYEMVFNAKLNQTKTYIPSKNNFEPLKEELYKMIKDKKNIEYKDQLYFSLANMELKNLDTLSAIRSLELSTSTSIDNNSQKLESHYLLANIFWAQNEYVKSYNHSDSAYALIKPTHKNYTPLKNMLRSSKKIAQLYNLINYNDSIINLAMLSEEERNEIIDNYILELKERDELLKTLNEQPSQNQRFNSYEYDKQAKNSMNITSGGGWYFYNPSAISLGYSEFLSRWGNRKLEDNWRRKNKNQVINEEELGIEGNGGSPSEKDKYNRDYYISQLPLKEEDQLRLLSQIETSYYDLSAIFKEDISDYDQAIILYNELIDRFPSTDYKQLIYFDLHNIFNLKSDTAQAQFFLNKIANEFPNSDYLQMLKTGGTHTSQLEKDKKTYRIAHDLYINQTVESCVELNSLFKTNQNNIFVGQIELLTIFCDAINQEKKDFIKSLESVSEKYSNTEIAKNVDEIISILKGEKETHRKDGYLNKFESPHEFILLLNDLSINLPKTQKIISQFNAKNYKLDSLEINNFLLNKDTQVLKVGKFKNKRDGMVYYELIQNSETTQSLFKQNNTHPLLIGEDNLLKLLKEKNINEYINYFNTIYLLN